jgi:hypothetical protein
MAIAYSPAHCMPSWAKVQWQHDPLQLYVSVLYTVTCEDGAIRLLVTMPDATSHALKRRRVLQSMIEQLNVQLATLTLEET